MPIETQMKAAGRGSVRVIEAGEVTPHYAYMYNLPLIFITIRCVIGYIRVFFYVV